MNHSSIICILASVVMGFSASAAVTATPMTTTTTTTAKTTTAKAKPAKTAAKKAGKKNAQDTLKSTAAAPTSSAHFNESDSASSNYSSSAVERPLILPQGLKQAAVRVNMNRVSAASKTDTGWASDYAFEAGLGNHMQVGAAVETVMSPDTEFGFFIGNAQYGINENINARIDLGVIRNRASEMNFTLGLGAPAKFRLNGNTALIGGRSDTLAATNGMSQTDDIFTIAESTNGSVISLGMPVGIEHSFNGMFSGRARTGYRAVFTPGTTNISGTTTSFIPLNVDAQFTPVRAVDIVASMGFDGAITKGVDYTDFFNAGVMGRFRF